MGANIALAESMFRSQPWTAREDLVANAYICSKSWALEKQGMCALPVNQACALALSRS